MAKRAYQLPFPFEHRPSLDGENFLVAPCNREAVAWLDRWPDWPAPALAIYGPPGSGKTHLLHVFLRRSGARLLDLDGLGGVDPLSVFAEAPACAIEDVDRDDGAALDEQALLHLYNAAAQAGGHLLLTAARPPSRWPLSLPDLRSRLGSVPTAAIRAPDDQLMEALLVKLFGDRQLEVDRGVVSFMLARMERSFDAARRLVDAVDREALAERRDVTVPLVRTVLARDTEKNP